MLLSAYIPRVKLWHPSVMHQWHYPHGEAEKARRETEPTQAILSKNQTDMVDTFPLWQDHHISRWSAHQTKKRNGWTCLGVCLPVGVVCLSQLTCLPVCVSTGLYLFPHVFLWSITQSVFLSPIFFTAVLLLGTCGHFLMDPFNKYLTQTAW